MSKQPGNEVPLAGPEEVVAIGNPESKPIPKRVLPFPSGHPTRHQAKKRAKLENIITNPKYSDDNTQQPVLSKGQKKRIRYRTRTGTK